MSIGIGDALREARQQAGIRLADAAADTRIRSSHLRALEDENFAPIGGDVYVKGFIRSYARHLGLDPEPLVAAYRQTFEAEHEEPPIASRRPVEAPPAPRRPLTTIVVVLAVLTLGGLALLGFLAPEDDEPEEEASAPPPVETEDPDDDEAGAPADDGPDDDDRMPEGEDDDGDVPDGGGGQGGDDGDDEEAPADPDELVLTFSVTGGESWARVLVDGEHVDEAVWPSGHSRTYTGETIVMRIGDAGNAALEVNGEDLGSLGPGGAVVDVECTASSAQCEIG